MRHTSSAYRRRVRWLPPAARIPSRRSASEYVRDAAIAARACASVYRGPILTMRTLVRSSDGTLDWGARIRTPASRTKTWRATPITPLPSARRKRIPRCPLHVLVRPVRVVLRRANGVALAVLVLGAVVLGDALAVGEWRRAARVLGPVDQLGFGELEALGLAAAGLLDDPARRVGALARRKLVVVAAGLGTDVRSLSGGLFFLPALEFSVGFHARFLPHRAGRSNRAARLAPSMVRGLIPLPTPDERA